MNSQSRGYKLNPKTTNGSVLRICYVVNQMFITNCDWCTICDSYRDTTSNLSGPSDWDSTSNDTFYSLFLRYNLSSSLTRHHVNILQPIWVSLTTLTLTERLNRTQPSFSGRTWSVTYSRRGASLTLELSFSSNRFPLRSLRWSILGSRPL